MKPQRITSIDEYRTICNKYQLKTSLSNNYLLPGEVEQLIENNKLSYISGDENCYFLVKKIAGCQRLYYLVNNKEEFDEIPSDTVAEILFRTPSGAPEHDMMLLCNLGFKENLIRDQYSAKIPEGINATITYSETLSEAVNIVALFNSTFDKYSGDFIIDEETFKLHHEHSLLVVREDGVMKGAMHITLQGSALWISHIAVFPDYRRQGVADKLMAMYFSEAQRLNAKRLMLWVQRQNKAATMMYIKYGFQPVNKSTISFIKY